MHSYTQPSQTEPNLKLTTHKWLLILSWMAATAFFAACEEGSQGLGAEVLPAEERIGLSFTDSIPITMETLVIDSIDTYLAPRQLFGNYIDPLFGYIQAKTFTQLLPRSELDFGDTADLRFDSLVLRLDIDGAYGRLEQVQELEVFRMTEAFPDTGAIFSSRELPYDPANLAEGQALDFRETFSGEVSIRLEDQLGRDILFGDPEVLGDRDRFQSELLPGLVLGTKPVKFINREPGAIFSLLASSNDTYLELHYHRFDSTSQEFVKRVEPFLIINSTPRYHSISRSELGDKLLATAVGDPDTLREYEFIQSGLLTKTWVQLGDLGFGRRVLISKAEIVFPIDPSTLGGLGQYVPPSPIVALRADENKQEILQNNLGLSVSSSTQDILFDSDRQAYVISITGYVQRLVNEQVDNNGFLIIPNNARFSIARAVLAGTDHPNPDLRPRLEVTYGNVPQ